MFKKPELSVRNEKPQRKNQDSDSEMGNFPPRGLVVYIVNIMQTHIVRQLSKVFDKSAFFCKTKPIYVRQKFTQALF